MVNTQLPAFLTMRVVGWLFGPDGNEGVLRQTDKQEKPLFGQSQKKMERLLLLEGGYKSAALQEVRK